MIENAKIHKNIGSPIDLFLKKQKHILVFSEQSSWSKCSKDSHWMCSLSVFSPYRQHTGSIQTAYRQHTGSIQAAYKQHTGSTQAALSVYKSPLSCCLSAVYMLFRPNLTE